jgi:hypothetical protein
MARTKPWLHQKNDNDGSPARRGRSPQAIAAVARARAAARSIVAATASRVATNAPATQCEQTTTTAPTPELADTSVVDSVPTPADGTREATSTNADVKDRNTVLNEIIIEIISHPWNVKSFHHSNLPIAKDVLLNFADGIKMVKSRQREAGISDELLMCCLINKIIDIRREAKNFGTQKCQTLILLTAKELGLVEVNTLKDLVKQWKEVHTQKMAACMWRCLHGAFDRWHNGDWNHHLGKLFMQNHSPPLTYAPQKIIPKVKETDKEQRLKTGCFDSIMSHAKNMIVVNFNDKFKPRSRICLGRQLKGDPEIEKKKHKKRKPEETLGPFCFINYKPEYHVKEILSEIMREDKVVYQTDHEALIRQPLYPSPKVQPAAAPTPKNPTSESRAAAVNTLQFTKSIVSAHNHVQLVFQTDKTLF